MKTTPLVIALVLFTCGIAAAAPAPPPRVTGQEPPAMAPYAPDDPIPKLRLVMHEHPRNGHQMAETFLSLLSHGYHPGMDLVASGTIPGDDRAFEKAWELMGPNRPTYEAFQANWTQTVRVGIVQFEPVTPTRFFVEFEQLAWLRNTWNVSYHSGWLNACSTGNEWRICSFEFGSEPLVVHNIGGHQGWQHSLSAAVFIGWGSEKEWQITAIRYERRTATVRLRHRTTGRKVTRRFARIEEGTWLEITRPRPSSQSPGSSS